MLLKSVSVNRRAGTRVMWRKGYAPVSTPYTGQGTVFLSIGKETYVTWDISPARPVLIATIALEAI